MHLDIITPVDKVFTGEIKLIQLPGTNGFFELMDNHAPIISTLNSGKIRVIANDGHEESFEIGGGVLESANNKVIVLIESV